MMSWVTQNWPIKLISLVLAIGLWYYAVGEESVEVKRTIPLEIEVENEQISILKSSVKQIWVTFAAPRNVLSDLTSEDIKAVHVIGNEANAAGEYSFRLEASEIKLKMPQVRIVQIVPEIIQVTLDELIVQKLKVTPAFVGKPAFGYKIADDEIEIDPNVALIQGPKGQLEKLDAVMTENIDVIGRIRSFRRTVDLALPANVESLSEQSVDIFIPIKEEFSEKTFEAIPVKIMKSPEQQVATELDQQVVSFVLKGSSRILETLKPEAMVAFLDVTDLLPGTHDLNVQVVLPDDISLKDKVAVKVTITARTLNA